jgi:hypothetical protein
MMWEGERRVSRARTKDIRYLELQITRNGKKLQGIYCKEIH